MTSLDDALRQLGGGPAVFQQKYGPEVLANAAYAGDLDMLERLLFLPGPDKFTGDVSAHVTENCPLHFASLNGQTEAVDLLLKAKADPHMRQNMPYGVDPKDGKTARQLAADLDYEEVAELLRRAEGSMKPRRYMRYGMFNNAALKLYDEGTSADAKDAFEPVKRMGYVPGAISVPVKSTIGLLFPGQGSQYVKMLSTVKDIPEVKNYIAIAKTVLDFDPEELCMNGPEGKLEETRYCQPCMFLAGMAGLEKMKQQYPDSKNFASVAGLSLGEYTALCAAGVFTFEEGMRLVKVRSEAMSEAAKLRKQGQMSVAGLDQRLLEDLCKMVESEMPGEVCKIANVLFPKGFSCAGTNPALDRLEPLVIKAGAMQAKKLKLSGAFHTDLMKPAQVKLEKVLQEILPRMKPPTCDVYLNYDGQRVKAGTPPEKFIHHLSDQLCGMVLWEASVRGMIKDGMTDFYEVGPMKQLKAMMKRINPERWTNTTNIEV